MAKVIEYTIKESFVYSGQGLILLGKLKGKVKDPMDLNGLSISFTVKDRVFNSRIIGVDITSIKKDKMIGLFIEGEEETWRKDLKEVSLNNLVAKISFK